MSDKVISPQTRPEWWLYHCAGSWKTWGTYWVCVQRLPCIWIRIYISGKSIQNIRKSIVFWDIHGKHYCTRGLVRMGNQASVRIFLVCFGKKNYSCEYGGKMEDQNPTKIEGLMLFNSLINYFKTIEQGFNHILRGEMQGTWSRHVSSYFMGEELIGWWNHIFNKYSFFYKSR